MRVSFVLDAFSGGGKERRCLQLIQGLEAIHFGEVQVIIVNNGIEYKELYESSASIEIINRKERHLGELQTLKELNSLLSVFNPDIVQAWGTMSAGLVLLDKLFYRNRYKFVASYVANINPPKSLTVDGLITTLCKLSCDKIVGNSLAGLSAYGIPDSKACLIYNGFNEERFNNKLVDLTSKKNQCGISTTYVVSMFASFSKTKDWSCFIEAARIIIDKRNDITFLCVGDGPDKEGYIKSVPADYKDRLIFTGRRDDVDELYQICDLTVLTSTKGEGLSNSLLESMVKGFLFAIIVTNWQMFVYL